MSKEADTIEKLEPHSNQLEPSRWYQLFGTPERAARTLHGIAIVGYTFAPCVACNREKCMTSDCDALLEWLKGDV